jgi:hypothetical protein
MKCIQDTNWENQKRPLQRLRHRWEDNIKPDLREIVWCNIDFIHLAQDRVQWQATVDTE